MNAPTKTPSTPATRTSRLGLRSAKSEGSLKISTQVVVSTTVVFISDPMRLPTIACRPRLAERKPRAAMPFGVAQEGWSLPLVVSVRSDGR